MAIFDRKFIDVYVASDGDYNSVATAFSTEGADKTYFIKGSFSESADVVPPDNCVIIWQDVILNMASGYYVHFTGVSNIKMSGQLRIVGDGETGNRTILKAESNVSGIDAFDCDITVQSTYIAAHTGLQFPVYLRWSKSKFNLTIEALSAQASSSLYGLATWVEFNYNYGILNVEGLTNSAGVATRGIDSKGSYNTLFVNIQDVTTTTGNFGVGVRINSGSNYNAFVGCSRGSDSSNLSDAGTGNKTVSLAT